MPRKSRFSNSRRRPFRGRRQPVQSAFRSPTYTDTLRANLSMSSTTNDFRVTFKELLPSLQTANRAVRLFKLKIAFPPVPEACSAQVIYADQTTNTLVPLSRPLVLSTSYPRTLYLTIPRYYSDFVVAQSILPAFTLQMVFNANTTIKVVPVITSTWFLSPDVVTGNTPIPRVKLEDTFVDLSLNQ